MRKRIAVAAAVLAVSAASLTTPAFASPAVSAAPASVCSENFGFVLYYNSNKAGSSACFFVAQNFAGAVFTEPGAGQGQAVKNNAASAENWGTRTARVFYNSNYAGVYDDVKSHTSRNLVNTYNENASWEWVG
ncbi:peptidase inhibitor family I36 protein [Actinacidiphila sp. DG2A-62]|uniref:peptidase inhibitor family I36 protein n=1 Tax=Actinacidiphila sp. DG2A-62 TaxID=3108821 RepID=UPI002DBF48A1|nr:peptidase inhibitor family I36 protein [Actinacidiphila sp. DG2A-62]MEC3992940.1 peptidase inhibitor family I36 protein [Actinacidiphila sp. DG2A-62]